MNAHALPDLLADDRPHLFDGAMGTMLYSNGVFINQCYDELALTKPDLVKGIHDDYVQAGAEIIETNTFGANAMKLEKHGLEQRVFEINAAAARLAKRAAGERALVAGSIGPLGIRIEPYGPTALEEARDCFRQQVEGLADGGVDLFILETFTDLAEIQQAILAVREATDLPVIAQMTVREDGTTLFGTPAELIAQRLDQWGADVIGLNCSVGPHGILGGIERIAAATTRPLSAQPNAGAPREIDGRKIYMASPDYFARYAQRLIRTGARFVGGCCGTTPEHVRRMADAVRALSPGQARPHAVLTRVQATDGAVDPVPLDQRSRLGRKLAAGELVTSVEIVPPKGADPAAMLVGARRLRDAGVDAVNVPDGPRAQMRMGVIAASVLIERDVGIEAVVHYTCRDRNLLGMLSDLLGAQALGLRNLLLITGDPPRMGPYPDATAVFDIDAIGLTNLVARLNHGLDPGANPIGDPTSFTIGVGANPGAVDLGHELNRFYWKAEAGAEYAITQPVFDVDQLMAFVRELDRRKIRIPIVAGIWPLVSSRNAEFLANEVPGITVPERIIERMRLAQARGKEHALDEGIAIARETFASIRAEVQGLQVSAPFGKVDFALRVLDGVIQPAARPAAAPS
ncbi:MAG: bifunctional homocysteine S-methyltransferase/methylenetetrahydrofolate reductase [Gemmatimonadota bacterium]